MVATELPVQVGRQAWAGLMVLMVPLVFLVESRLVHSRMVQQE